jgi:hypothetical protein
MAGNITYKWYVLGDTPPAVLAISGVGLSYSTYTHTTPLQDQKIYCTVSTDYQCDSASSYTTNNITVNIGTPNVSLTILSDVNGICTGDTVNFTAYPIGYGSPAPTYEWKVGSTVVGTNSSTWSSSTLANGNVVSCTTSKSGYDTKTDSITMVVNSRKTPSVSITEIYYNGVTQCYGATLFFVVSSPNNLGSNPTYSWQRGVDPSWTTVKSGQGGSYAWYQTDNTTSNYVRLVVSTINGCVTSTSTISTNWPLISSNPSVIPTITLDASPYIINEGVDEQNNPYYYINILAGYSVTFTTSRTNGGASPVYAWWKNGSDTGVATPNYTSSSWSTTTPDFICCKMTSNASCVNPAANPVTSIVVHVHVNSVGVSRGYVAGGTTTNPTNLYSSSMSKIVYSTNPTLSNIGSTLAIGVNGLAGVQSTANGYFGGGGNSGSDKDLITKLSFSDETSVSLGNAVGKKLTAARDGIGGFSNPKFGFFIGGHIGTTTNIVDKIELDTDTVTAAGEGHNLNSARDGVAGAGCNSSFAIIAGGSTTNLYQNAINTVERFLYSNETFGLISGQYLSSGMFQLSCVNSNTNAYFSLGWANDGTHYGGLDKINISTGVVTPNMNTLLERSGAVGIGNTTYGFFMGGRYGNPPNIIVPGLNISILQYSQDTTAPGWATLENPVRALLGGVSCP